MVSRFLGTKRHVPPQKTKAEAVKAVQRELRNLTMNYLEWQINDVAIRVIKPDASVGKGGRSSFRRVRRG